MRASLVLLVACSSGTTTPVRNDRSAATPETFCASLASPLRCSADEQLLERVQQVRAIDAEIAACAARAKLHVAFDATRAAACTAARAAQLRDDPFAADLPQACAGVMRGLVASGQPCRDSIECADHGRCDKVCVAAPEKESCVFDVPVGYGTKHTGCGAGVQCNIFGIGPETPVCMTAAVPNGACDEFHLCPDGRCVHHVCAVPLPPPVAIGGSCDDEMALRECVPGASCNGDRVCSVVKHAGEQCTNNDDCRGQCVDGACVSLCGSG